MTEFSGEGEDNTDTGEAATLVDDGDGLIGEDASTAEDGDANFDLDLLRAWVWREFFMNTAASELDVCSKKAAAAAPAVNPALFLGERLLGVIAVGLVPTDSVISGALDGEGDGALDLD